MGTHYHLVLETTTERLSAGMHYLNGVYAQRFNRRHDRDGHVFGARFASWVVRDDDHYERTIEYVLTNPVRAGLVDDWTEWRWSGARGVRSTAQMVLDAERTRRQRPAVSDLLVNVSVVPQGLRPRAAVRPIKAVSAQAGSETLSEHTFGG